VADQQVALFTHAAATAEQCVTNKQHTAAKKAALWQAVVVVLVILTNVAIFPHVVTVFAVCTVTAVSQACVV
jgi:hypothetical protein